MIEIPTRALIVKLDGPLLGHTELGNEFLVPGAAPKTQEIFDMGVVVCGMTDLERSELDHMATRLGIHPLRRTFDLIHTKTDRLVGEDELAVYRTMALLLRNLHGIGPEDTVYTDNDQTGCQLASRIGFNVVGIASRPILWDTVECRKFPLIPSLRELEVVPIPTKKYSVANRVSANA